MNIYQALAAVMADVDHVAKRDRNEQQRFLFRGVDAVVNAVGPALRKHKVIVVPTVESVDYAMMPTKNGGQMTSCRVRVTYTFHAEDGSSLVASVAAEAFDYGDKATPKAMSVAFRTALLQALALPTDEPEPDSQAYQTAAAGATPQAVSSGGTQRMSRASSGTTITDAQLRALHAAFSGNGITDRDLALEYVATVIGHSVESTKELTKAEASKVIDRLKADTEPAPEVDDGWGQR